MKSIHIFIISWIGQHENAVFIRNQLKNNFANVTIVYSDPDDSFSIDPAHDQIRRPSDLYWSDKFSTCLKHCQSYFMMVIHADCKADDWLALCKRTHMLMDSNENFGVCSPKIEGTYFDLSKTTIGTITDTALTIVAQTDGMVFTLALPIQNRMRRANYKSNVFGWGINWMACCCAYTLNKIVVVDRTFTVHHPPSRSYNGQEALAQMRLFLEQLTHQERVQYILLSKHVHQAYEGQKVLANV